MIRPPRAISDTPTSALSGDFSIVDMVNRLEPRELRWIESSLAEQQFLGWTFHELQRKSFLEILHPDDRARAEEALRAALVKGEATGPGRADHDGAGKEPGDRGERRCAVRRRLGSVAISAATSPT